MNRGENRKVILVKKLIKQPIESAARDKPYDLPATY